MNSKSVLDHKNDIPFPRRKTSLPDKLGEGNTTAKNCNFVENFTLKFTNTYILEKKFTSKHIFYVKFCYLSSII